MKCQVCHTKEKSKFGFSILICDLCLMKKQMKHMTEYLNQQNNNILLFGTPVKYIDFGAAQTEEIDNAKSTSEPLTFEKIKKFADDMKPLSFDKIPFVPLTWSDNPSDNLNCRCVSDFTEEEKRPKRRCIECARMDTNAKSGRCPYCMIALYMIDGTEPISKSQWIAGIDARLTQHFGKTPKPYPHHT